MDSQEKKESKPKLSTLLCVILFGVFLLVTGYTLGFKILPEFVENQIWESVVLRNNTEQWKVFEEIPFPFTSKMYIFNITNSEEVLQGAKPIIQEVGPYVYKLYKWKSDIQWRDDEIISYRNNERYEFDQFSSGVLSDGDVVVILNPVWNTVIQTAEAESPEAIPTLNTALPHVFGQYNRLFISIAVKQFLFDGFSLCDKERFEKGGFAAKVVCSQMRSKSADSKGMLLLEDRIMFSYFYDKNASSSGVYSINSGIFEKEEVGKLVLFENGTNLHYWGDGNNYCNSLKSVVTFPPFVKRDTSLQVFAEDICRTVIMDYIGEDSILDVKGYKFEMRSDTFDSLKSKEEHRCFCDNKTRDLNGLHCLDNGLLDLQNCVGAPMIFSNPHLLWADPRYTDTVEGFQPIRDLHTSYVVLEPVMDLCE